MRIGIIAPARELDRAVAARTAAFAAIAFPEVDLVFHPQCFLSSGHFAGTDDQRATAFLEMANDPAIDALWFGRGGYGSNRILTRVVDRSEERRGGEEWGRTCRSRGSASSSKKK